MNLRRCALSIPFIMAKRSARVAYVSCAVVLTMFAAGGTALAGQPKAATPDQTEANRLMNLHAEDFVSAPHKPPFNWSSDGCSGSTRPEFKPACIQHDFGYRNYGGRGHLGFAVTRDTKNWIDLRFHDEMYRICENYAASLPDRQHVRYCDADAEQAFTFVQDFGGSSFFGQH